MTQDIYLKHFDQLIVALFWHEVTLFFVGPIGKFATDSYILSWQII